MAGVIEQHLALPRGPLAVSHSVSVDSQTQASAGDADGVVAQSEEMPEQVVSWIAMEGSGLDHSGPVPSTAFGSRCCR